MERCGADGQELGFALCQSDVGPDATKGPRTDQVPVLGVREEGVEVWGIGEEGRSDAHVRHEDRVRGRGADVCEACVAGGGAGADELGGWGVGACDCMDVRVMNRNV